MRWSLCKVLFWVQVSVDVALARVFCRAVSAHYVGCCHPVALKVGFKAVKRKICPSKHTEATAKTMTRPLRDIPVCLLLLIYCAQFKRHGCWIHSHPSTVWGLSAPAASACVMSGPSSSWHSVGITYSLANSSNSLIVFVLSGEHWDGSFQEKHSLPFSRSARFHWLDKGPIAPGWMSQHQSGRRVTAHWCMQRRCLRGGSCGNTPACFSLHQTGTDRD